MNILVFDLEVRKDPNLVGWKNYDAMGISLGCAWLSWLDEYRLYEESEVWRLMEDMNEADLIVGFNIMSFDIPLLYATVARVFKDKLSTAGSLISNREVLCVNLCKDGAINPKCYDMLDDIRDALSTTRAKGWTLENVARCNLKVQKNGHGADAPGLWERGEIEKLAAYVMQDVRVEKELFFHMLNTHELENDFSDVQLIQVRQIDGAMERAQERAATRVAGCESGDVLALKGLEDVLEQAAKADVGAGALHMTFPFIPHLTQPGTFEDQTAPTDFGNQGVVMHDESAISQVTLTTPQTSAVVAARCLGVKEIMATPMTRKAYNELRGWELPKDEDGDDLGFLVEYLDGGKANHPDFKGYISWSPLEVFNRAYRAINGMTFGLALEAMKAGKKVARAGWNGKGMWITLSPGSKRLAADRFWSPNNRAWAKTRPDQQADILPCITMKTATDEILMGWLASQTDMLAEDWVIVE